MERKLLQTVIAVILTVLLPAAALSGCALDLQNAGGMAVGGSREFTKSAELQGKYDEVRAELDMISAKASIGKSESKLAEGSFRYSSETLKPDFEVDGNMISVRNKGAAGSSLLKPVNDWNVKLTDKAPINMEISSEASEGDFDLDGLMLKEIKLDANASSIKLNSSTSNPYELKRFDIMSNAGNYELYGLGNTNFERMDIDSRASKFVVDLTGSYKRDGVLRLKADASTFKLKLPDNIGVRIVIEKSDISTVLLDNDSISKCSDTEYESKDYDKSDIRLTIYMDLNITTVNIN